jgi:uncharacterized protein
LRANSVRWLLILAAAALIGLVAYFGVVGSAPAPTGRIMLATGGSDGAYNDLLKTYTAELNRNGIRLRLRNDLEGADALKAMLDDKTGVQGAVIKGGFIGSLTGRLASVKARDRHERESAKLRSLGRLFLEPIWVFTRGSLPIESLRDLTGKRILTGVRQSGGRRVAIQLLRANGVNSENAVLVNEELTDDARALVSGEADAAFLILPPESDRIQKLLRVRGIRLMNFAGEVDAYTGRFPSLSKAFMHRGSVEFEPVIPSADITLLATSAALVVRSDIDPALASLLAHAVIRSPKQGFDRAGDPILFYRAGEFPNANDPELDVMNDARLVYKSGELPFWLRIMAPFNTRASIPFSATSFVHAHGTKLLVLIPLIAVLVPLSRVLPAIYVWSVRRRLIYWYRQLKALERRLDGGATKFDPALLQDELERIDAAVRRIRVPLYFANQLYDLRGHIDLVRQRLMIRPGPLRIAAE